MSLYFFLKTMLKRLLVVAVMMLMSIRLHAMVVMIMMNQMMIMILKMIVSLEVTIAQFTTKSYEFNIGLFFVFFNLDNPAMASVENTDDEKAPCSGSDDVDVDTASCDGSDDNFEPDDDDDFKDDCHIEGYNGSVYYFYFITFSAEISDRLN